MTDQLARAEFSKARRKAFWKKVQNWFSRQHDDLLPYDEVRSLIPIRGQRYRGLQTIPIKQIVGSMGRYHEFTRAFLPKQTHTQSRWINISRAHYEDIHLPPIEVYKLGEVYFIKDGNHRVSVGRQLGMEFIDAYITEIDIPVRLTPETRIDDLQLKHELAMFLEKTKIKKHYPESDFDMTLRGEVKKLLTHIETHQYYLGLNSGLEPTFEDAVRSWYESVYLPLVEEIEKQDLKLRFKNLTNTDLYVLISEYQWLLREAYSTVADFDTANSAFSESLARIQHKTSGSAKKVTRAIENAPWLDAFILSQEGQEFKVQTGLNLSVSAPGRYSALLQHIHDHRWYLGVEQQEEIEWDAAVKSWFENIYLPLVEEIRELGVLSSFPNRTETDLYVWIIKHQAELSDSLGWSIPIDIVAKELIDLSEETEDRSPKPKFPRQIFKNILVPVGDAPEDLIALEQAAVIAEKSQGTIYGLHVVTQSDELDEVHHNRLEKEFNRIASTRNIKSNFAMTTGSVAKVIAQRSHWVDLIVLNLKHPPSKTGLSKIASGFRYVLRRSNRPVLAVPKEPTQLNNILLAYDGSPLADEALLLCSELITAAQDRKLTILVSTIRKKKARKLLKRAKSFMAHHAVKANYLHMQAPAGEAILEAAQEYKCDLIVMGGYGAAPIVELTQGSTIDMVLQKSKIPILIRT